MTPKNGPKKDPKNKHIIIKYKNKNKNKNTKKGHRHRGVIGIDKKNNYFKKMKKSWARENLTK